MGGGSRLLAAVLVASCGAAGGDDGVGEAAPVFLKLHKVGSTTAALMFESRAFVEGAVAHGCRRCLGRRGFRFEGLRGPWSHETALLYAREGGFAPFAECGCSASGPFVVLREPVDRFVSMVGFFLRPPYVRGRNASLAARFLEDPTAATARSARRVLRLFDWRFPHVQEDGALNALRLREYASVLGVAAGAADTRATLERARVVVGSVETNHWFGSAQATLKLVSLAQNEVVSARSLRPSAHLCFEDLRRSGTDLSRHIRSDSTMLHVS